MSMGGDLCQGRVLRHPLLPHLRHAIDLPAGPKGLEEKNGRGPSLLAALVLVPATQRRIQRSTDAGTACSGTRAAGGHAASTIFCSPACTCKRLVRRGQPVTIFHLPVPPHGHTLTRESSHGTVGCVTHHHSWSASPDMMMDEGRGRKSRINIRRPFPSSNIGA